MNAADEHGYTPLHCAVSGYAHTPSDATWWNASSDGSDITATRALLKHGADPNRAGIDTITPLLLAVRSTYEAVPCIRALIGGGADPNLATGAGTTPLMHAAGRGRLENVRTLLELGADPHRTDRYRQNALHYARRYLDQCREEAGLEASPDAAYAPDDQFEALQSQAIREQQVSAESCVALLKEILGG